MISLRRHLRMAAGVLGGALATSLLVVGAGAAPSQADAFTYTPWSSSLAGWTDQYVPSSDNDCVAGRPSCLKATLKELGRAFEENGKSCSHNSIFSMSYLRITQTYGWVRDQPGYFSDVRFANHQDAVFARYYTTHYYNWKNGNRGAVPQSWLVAFDAARDHTVTGTGDLMLGMNAHINRDLPFVVAAVGLVAPDGSSRKPDFDKVEEFLNAATGPLMAELAARFDPTIDDSDDPMGAGYWSVFQMISAWRENAWRNAERLVSAPTEADRAAVAAEIESSANATAQSLLASEAYAPPLSSTNARDFYCSTHYGAAAPRPYPFGMPTPWGY